MKICAIVLLLVALAAPVSAVILHDEAIDGDLATDPNTPTPLAFIIGGNTIAGTTGNTTGTVDRDYITFTIPPDHKLVALNLHLLAPDNIAFASFNAGTTSFIPNVANSPLFLAGIHVASAHVGTDLMPEFVCCSVTTNSLPAPELGPGDYCFLIQQTSPILQSYTLEFVIGGPVGVEDKTWGVIKALYR
jgi:hypothetical protein